MDSSEQIWDSTKDQYVPVSQDSFKLHYDRAKWLVQRSGLVINDIKNLTSKFWDFHLNPIATRDMTAFIIATIHINLCIGTISQLSTTRPDLSPLLEDLINFEVCGEFMLTEIGHGLDARNLETTATLQPDGTFDLHSPNRAAWKAMSPSTPLCGMPRMSVVFARLIIQSKDHGIKPFIVWLNDSKHMFPGITSRILPNRPGTKPLDHSLTSFNHVSLPSTALLGSISKPENLRVDFLQQIWRVSVGTLSLSLMGVSSIKVASCIGAMYSQRRLTTAKNGTRKPIFDFSTQKRPILTAVTSGIVLEHFAHWTIKKFADENANKDIQRAFATIFKSTVTRESRIIGEIANRCGWQGLFEYNQIIGLQLTFQGNSVAEGDTLVLCIRLASELLGQKYSVPKPKYPTCFLAQHEAGLFTEAHCVLSHLDGYENHRGPGFNDHVLPKCKSLIEAIGQRMAYEAAKDFGCNPVIIALYEKLCIEADLSWYTENCGISRSGFFESMDIAYANAVKCLLCELGEQEKLFKDFIYAAFVTDESWEAFLLELKAYESNISSKL